MILSLLVSFTFAINIWERLDAPMVAGHRGGMQDSSYNTLERFRQAIREDVDILEMDLRTTKDGIVVVFHDEDLDGKTHCSGLVANTNWDIVKNCKYDGTQHKVPSFEQVVIEVAGRKILNAEFKTLSTIAPSIKILRQYQAYDWIYFQVNSEMDKYHAARAIDRGVALLYKPRNEQELTWLETINDPMIVVAQMDKDFVNRQRIERVHRLGKFVSVNSWKWDLLEERFQSKCQSLYAMGIDITVTNNTIDCVRVRNRIRQ
jgi:glycerophosphoryl diester phosphodiesterase